ncbi:hypothetical protein JKP88DRAFT_137047, partial [Tribonema minus]
GHATYYGAGGAGVHGACSQDFVYPGYVTVAMNTAQYNGGLVCGACVRACITKPSGRECYNAIVDNECPSCANNDLDFGLAGTGIYPVNWTYIQCPYRSSLLISTQGSNGYYGKIKVQGSGALTGLTARGITATSTHDGFWVVNDGSGNLGCGSSVTASFTYG